MRLAQLGDYEIDRSPYGSTSFVLEVRLTKNDDDGTSLEQESREFTLTRGFSEQVPELEPTLFTSRRKLTNDVLDKCIRHAVDLMLQHRDDYSEWKVVWAKVEERELIRDTEGHDAFNNIDIEEP